VITPPDLIGTNHKMALRHKNQHILLLQSLPLLAVAITVLLIGHNLSMWTEICWKIGFKH